ncbi:MAG: DUF885 domain-containing protein [Gammaproteobacteria bacterium]|nr:DUF885 domain-containing protein [Gammaproteobacteria bacterium]
MKSVTFAWLAALLLATGCSGGQDQEAPDTAAQADPAAAAAALTALVEEYFERNLELSPLTATSIGDDRYDDRIANFLSREHIEATAALDREFLERLGEIDESLLQGQDRLTYGTFRLSRQNSLDGKRFPGELQPINQFFSIPNFFAVLGSGASIHPFRTVKNYDDWLSRMDGYVVLMDQAIENMKIGMREGVVQPRVLMEKVLPQLEAQFTDTAEDSNFFAPIRMMPEDFGNEDRERLTAAYKQKIERVVIPAYRRLHNFIGDEYLGAARESVGLSELPNGEEWYAYLVRLRTTTDLTPEEIHQIGLDEVARIHDEMRGVMKVVNFEGDLQDFFDFMNNDEQFYFDEPEELIQGYRDMSDHIASLAPKLFDVFPKTPFEVRRVEPFRERSAAGGSYSRGAPDGSRPGIFYANAYDIKARPKWAMEALFLHEAIPGHHFQIALQQELEGLPRFRRFGGYTAFIEGWGLYAESLGKELGVYTDPYQYFGALNAELWRAIRLVVDTGLHAKGWSRQDVLDYMVNNSPVKDARAVSEAERFIAIPGQALAYKIGQLKILELRRRAEETLGDRFDVRDFHAAVLLDGPLPLEMLEEKIDRWIAARA